jgi:hypothetical protein
MRLRRSLRPAPSATWPRSVASATSPRPGPPSGLAARATGGARRPRRSARRCSSPRSARPARRGRGQWRPGPSARPRTRRTRCWPRRTRRNGRPPQPASTTPPSARRPALSQPRAAAAPGTPRIRLTPVPASSRNRNASWRPRGCWTRACCSPSAAGSANGATARWRCCSPTGCRSPRSSRSPATRTSWPVRCAGRCRSRRPGRPAGVPRSTCGLRSGSASSG